MREWGQGGPDLKSGTGRDEAVENDQGLGGGSGGDFGEDDSDLGVPVANLRCTGCGLQVGG